MQKKLQVEGFLEGTIPYVKKIENVPYHIPYQQIGGEIRSKNSIINWDGYQGEEKGKATIYFTTQGIFVQYPFLKPKQSKKLDRLNQKIIARYPLEKSNYPKELDSFTDRTKGGKSNLSQESLFLYNYKGEFSSKGYKIYVHHVYEEEEWRHSFHMYVKFKNKKEVEAILQEIEPYYHLDTVILYISNKPYISLRGLR